MQEIPFLSRARLTEQLTIKIEKDLAKEIRSLRAEYAVDTATLVRVFLREQLPKIRRQLEKEPA